jgi:hypothetical protein
VKTPKGNEIGYAIRKDSNTYDCDIILFNEEPNLSIGVTSVGPSPAHFDSWLLQVNIDLILEVLPKTKKNCINRIEHT